MCPDNVCRRLRVRRPRGDRGGLRQDPSIVRRRYVITRVARAVHGAASSLGVYDPSEDRYTLYADVQYPTASATRWPATSSRCPEHKIRVVAGDIGGAFGTKGWQYPSTS